MSRRAKRVTASAMYLVALLLGVTAAGIWAYLYGKHHIDTWVWLLGLFALILGMIGGSAVALRRRLHNRDLNPKIPE